MSKFKYMVEFGYVSPGEVMRRSLTRKVEAGQLSPKVLQDKMRMHKRSVLIGDLDFAKNRLLREDRTIPQIVPKHRELETLYKRGTLPEGQIRSINDGERIPYILDADSWSSPQSRMGSGWNRYAGMTDAHIQKVLPNLNRTIYDIKRRNGMT